MTRDVAQAEPMVVRHVFARWSIAIPLDFAESFVAKDEYWHAWDERRSVSLTSLILSDRRGRPVSADRIVKQIPAERGERVAMPAGLDGWAAVVTPPQPARASRAIAGIIAVNGAVLAATVTSDDLTWATAVWLSIHRRPAPSTSAGP